MHREWSDSLVRFSHLISRGYFPFSLLLSFISWALSWEPLFSFRAC